MNGVRAFDGRWEFFVLGNCGVAEVWTVLGLMGKIYRLSCREAVGLRGTFSFGF